MTVAEHFRIPAESAYASPLDAENFHVPDWRDYFTIYSGGKLDLNAAEAKVIALGIITSQSTADPVNDWEPALKDATNFIQDVRWGPDDIEFTEDDVKLQDLQQAYDALNLDGSDPDVPGLASVTLVSPDGVEATFVPTAGMVGTSQSAICKLIQKHGLEVRDGRRVA